LPPNHVSLLKLIWHPDDIEGERVKPTAFRRDDLSAAPNAHVSVDRADLAERKVMEKVAAQQAKNANGKTVKRDYAKIGIMNCGVVRSSEYLGERLFSVSPFPIDGNVAHCGIQSAIRAPKKSDVDLMRMTLAELASPPNEFDEAYPNKDP
jgi:hypothetical protein